MWSGSSGHGNKRTPGTPDRRVGGFALLEDETLGSGVLEEEVRIDLKRVGQIQRGGETEIGESHITSFDLGDVLDVDTGLGRQLRLGQAALFPEPGEDVFGHMYSLLN
jgi:hypothetical protein